MRRLGLADVTSARSAMERHLAPTPLRRSFALRRYGDVHLKLECWQPTGSFKVRGATHVLASLEPDERRRGVVAASAGNHALGVAYAAQATGGVAATVFVPESAPRTKVDKLRTFAVEVRQHGASYDDADALAREHAARAGAYYVHAYDDVRTAAGQGTVGLEILEQLAEVSSVVVPVGGGGLISGIATAVKALRPSARIVAVQPEASPSLRESLRLGRPLLTFPADATLADGLAGGIGELVFAHRDLIDDVVVVPEREIEDAVVALLSHDQVVCEGAGAAAAAAIQAGLVRADGPVVAVVTGGNIDAVVLARLLAARV